jgi:hypothetical protein
MTFQSRELYRSGPNGDRWSLVRDPTSGRVFIEHQPDISSGGQASRMEIGDFLAHRGHGNSPCCVSSGRWWRKPPAPKCYEARSAPPT